MPLQCPKCDSTELEMRGSRRCYAPLDDDGEIDGWNEGDIDWDGTEDGKELIYCLVCDTEFTRE